MATKGTTLRTDFTGDDSKFTKTLDRQKRKAKEYGQQWDKAGKQLKTVGKSGKSSAQGVLELSRGFEDLQYGVRGVLNNIPGIVMGFGGTAAAAGLVSFAAVGLDLAFRTFGKNGKKSVGGVSEEMEAMEKVAKAAADSIKAELEELGKAWDKWDKSISRFNDNEAAGIKSQQKRLDLANELALVKIEEERAAGRITDKEAHRAKLDQKRHAAALQFELGTKGRDQSLEAKKEGVRGTATQLEQAKARAEELKDKYLSGGQDPAVFAKLNAARKHVKQLEADLADERDQLKGAVNTHQREGIEAGEAYVLEQRKIGLEKFKEAAQKDIGGYDKDRNVFGSGGAAPARGRLEGVGPAGLSSSSFLVSGSKPRAFKGLDRLADLQTKHNTIVTSSLDELKKITREL